MGALFAKISPASQLSQSFPPPTTYDPLKEMPDLTGKVVIVTGGNTGLGYHTVKPLLIKNAKVYLTSRSALKGEEAIRKLKEETGKEAVLLGLDLADLTSVRAAAEEFLSKEERLDILFNNAGVMNPPLDMLTAQGYDLQLGTNALGHYFFTMLLLPALKRSADHSGTKARVVNTSSSGHYYAPGPTGLDWTTARGGPERDTTLKSWGSMAQWNLYGISKLGNIFISRIIARDHGDTIMSCAVHPGGTYTDLSRHAPPILRWLYKMLLNLPQLGAYPQLHAGTAPEAEGYSGKYLWPWARRVGKPDPRADNEKTQAELKDWLEEQLKGF